MDAWGVANRVVDSLHERFVFGAALLGCGLSRGFLGWLLAMTKEAETLGFSSGVAHGVLDAGEAAGFLIVALAASRLAPLYPRGLALCGSAALPALSATCVAAASLCDPSTLAASAFILGLFTGGLGYALLLSMWLELYGALPPRSALLAFAASETVSFLVWLVLHEGTALLGLVMCTLCVAGAPACLVLGYRLVAPDDRPSEPGTLGGSSWRLVAWTVTVSLVYGLNDGLARFGVSTWASKLGSLVPAAIVLACLVARVQRFDAHAFWLASFGLILTGIAASFAPQTAPAATQALLSAAKSALNMLLVSVICLRAYQRRTSAASYAAVLFGSSIVALQAGKLAGLALGSPSGQITAPAIAGMVAAVAASALIFNGRVLDRQLAEEVRQSGPRGGLAELATRLGLTERELAVLEMAVRGQSAQSVSEALFIAPSTVRSHLAHIYEKCGVHSQAELEQFVAVWLKKHGRH